MTRYLVYRADDKQGTGYATDNRIDAVSFARKASYNNTALWLVLDRVAREYTAKYRGGELV